MSKVDFGDYDYKPRGKLSGIYTVKVDSYTDYPQNGSVLLKFQIIDGPEPEEYRSPLGQFVTDFVNIDKDRCNEAWQIESMFDRLGDLATAFGLETTELDFDDLVGKEAQVRLYQKKNKKDGSVNTAVSYNID